MKDAIDSTEVDDARRVHEMLLGLAALLQDATEEDEIECARLLSSRAAQYAGELLQRLEELGLDGRAEARAAREIVAPATPHVVSTLCNKRVRRSRARRCA